MFPAAYRTEVQRLANLPIASNEYRSIIAGKIKTLVIPLPLAKIEHLSGLHFHIADEFFILNF